LWDVERAARHASAGNWDNVCIALKAPPRAASVLDPRDPAAIGAGNSGEPAGMDAALFLAGLFRSITFVVKQLFLEINS
jgi:hypothetical protein